MDRPSPSAMGVRQPEAGCVVAGMHDFTCPPGSCLAYPGVCCWLGGMDEKMSFLRGHTTLCQSLPIYSTFFPKLPVRVIIQPKGQLGNGSKRGEPFSSEALPHIFFSAGTTNTSRLNQGANWPTCSFPSMTTTYSTCACYLTYGGSVEQ